MLPVFLTGLNTKRTLNWTKQSLITFHSFGCATWSLTCPRSITWWVELLTSLATDLLTRFRFVGRCKMPKMHRSGLVSARKRDWGQQHHQRVPKRHFRRRRRANNYHHQPRLPITTISLTSGNKCHMGCYWKRRNNSSSISWYCSSNSKWLNFSITITPSHRQSHRLTTRKFFHRRRQVVDLMVSAATEAPPVISTQRKCRPILRFIPLHRPHQHQRQAQPPVIVTAMGSSPSMMFMGRVEAF